MKLLLIKNTLSSYLTVAVRLLQGILVTRWMIQYLGLEGYGVWALLWAIFSYALLLDFGFGVSAQKYTATGLYREDIGRYNSIISAIFSFHALVAVFIIIGSLIASCFAEQIFSVSDPEKLAYCRFCFLLFAFGAAIAFPTGVFPEILVGLKELYLRNLIVTGGKVVELLATLAIFLLGGKVASLVVLAIVLWLGNNLFMGFLIPRRIPGFRLTFRPDWRRCREVASFSWYVYLTSIAKLVLDKSSFLVISVCSGLHAVGIYQISGRLAEMCYMAGAQYQENVRPIAASLQAEGKFRQLTEFIFQSMRGNCLFGLLFMVPAWIYTPEALRFFFKVDDPEIFRLSRLFLAVVFLNLATRQILHSYLLMTGKHKFLAGAVIVEAGLNLALNILFIERFGVECVLWNAMLINGGMTLLLLFPVALAALKLSFFKILFQVYCFPIFLALPAAATAFHFRLAYRELLGNFFTAAAGSTLYAAIFLPLCFFLLLTEGEKQVIFDGLRRRLGPLYEYWRSRRSR